MGKKIVGMLFLGFLLTEGGTFRSTYTARTLLEKWVQTIRPSSSSSLKLPIINMGRQKVILEKMARIFQVRNMLMRQAQAECLGTLILVVRLFCCCCFFHRLFFFFWWCDENTMQSVEFGNRLSNSKVIVIKSLIQECGQIWFACVEVWPHLRFKTFSVIYIK